jgi:hypothetical protein
MNKHRAKPLSKSRPSHKRGPIQKPSATHDLMTIPRDHIIPFRANVFGLTRHSEPQDSVIVFDPDKRPSDGDAVVILWGDKSRRPEFGYFSAMKGSFDGSLSGKRHVQLLKRRDNTAEKDVRWFKLCAADLLAREIGTFMPHSGEGPKEGWPDVYKKLYRGHGLARSKEEWDRAQVFEIDNPVDSPWPGWERLSVDPDAPLGPDDWVAAIGPAASPKKLKHYLGKVASLKRSFEIEDVTTGARLKLGGPRQPYHGVVIGMSQRLPIAGGRSRSRAKGGTNV